MEKFIENILIGVRRWVNTKLTAISQTIAENIAALEALIYPMKEKLDGIQERAERNVIDAISVDGTIIKPVDRTVHITLPKTAIANVKEDDYILGLDDGELYTELGIELNDNQIQLIGKDGTPFSYIDASQFITDGALENVYYAEKDENNNWTYEGESGTVSGLPDGCTDPGKPQGSYIIFQWNTDGGETLTWTFVALSSFTVYSEGTGIEIKNNTISVKAAQTDKIGGVFVADRINSGLTLNTSTGELKITAPTWQEVYNKLDEPDEE